MIAFVQPFGLKNNGGGSRIMRALLGAEHPPLLVINTGLHYTPPQPGTEELHLPLRPLFGRIERTRFSRALGVFDGTYSKRFQDRLKRVLMERQVRAIHTIPHTYDIVPVSRVASELGIPCFLTIHDDLEYSSLGHPFNVRMLEALREAWINAKGIFVISEEIGKEYSRRYGPKEYQVVTDGLTSVAQAPLPRPAKSLRVYFMGLCHLNYASNFRALLDALKFVQSEHPDWAVSMTSRSGAVTCQVRSDDVPVNVLPFASEREVEDDMYSADMLYLPLPFEAYAAKFGIFSMSTKMVTYLGSGLPILFHGPQDSAACRLLASHEAAVACTSLDAETISRQLFEAISKRESIVNNALELDRARFMLADQQRRFWEPMIATM
jgi:hypothetical protein